MIDYWLWNYSRKDPAHLHILPRFLFLYGKVPLMINWATLAIFSILIFSFVAVIDKFLLGY